MISSFFVNSTKQSHSPACIENRVVHKLILAYPSKQQTARAIPLTKTKQDHRIVEAVEVEECKTPDAM